MMSMTNLDILESSVKTTCANLVCSDVIPRIVNWASACANHNFVLSGQKVGNLTDTADIRASEALSCSSRALIRS